jgi:hypothetical protein
MHYLDKTFTELYCALNRANIEFNYFSRFRVILDLDAFHANFNHRVISGAFFFFISAKKKKKKILLYTILVFTVLIIK